MQKGKTKVEKSEFINSYRDGVVNEEILGGKNCEMKDKKLRHREGEKKQKSRQKKNDWKIDEVMNEENGRVIWEMNEKKNKERKRERKRIQKERIGETKK